MSYGHEDSCAGDAIPDPLAQLSAIVETAAAGMEAEQRDLDFAMGSAVVQGYASIAREPDETLADLEDTLRPQKPAWWSDPVALAFMERVRKRMREQWPTPNDNPNNDVDN